MKTLALILCTLLTGCASSGFYAMSDPWCAKHPEASPARCVRNPLHQTDIQGHQVGTPGNLCPRQYRYDLEDGTFLFCWGRRT